MAPVILALQANPVFTVRILATAQHRQMLDQVLAAFGLIPDVDFDIMSPNQSLSDLTARLMTAFDKCLAEEQPDVVITQGDTTTVLCATLAAFYRRIDVAHVEAGLRTHNISNPFPEEANRVLVSRLARWHFAPTETARRHLLAEGVAENKVHVTGNTVIDALLTVTERAPVTAVPAERTILVTAHRRENFGAPFAEICRAVRQLADQRDDIRFIFPVHPNPNIQDVAYATLDNHPRITLCAPMDYLPFVAAMQQSYIILTDSGGVQEEAPALGKPVLVLRDETERPEAVDAGVVKLIGAHYQAIIENVTTLLDHPAAYAAMARGISPYGDGKAATRINTVLMQDLNADATLTA